MPQSLENATCTISVETMQNLKLIEAEAAPVWAVRGMLRTTSTDTARASLTRDVSVKGVSLKPKRGSKAR